MRRRRRWIFAQCARNTHRHAAFATLSSCAALTWPTSSAGWAGTGALAAAGCLGCLASWSNFVRPVAPHQWALMSLMPSLARCMAGWSMRHARFAVAGFTVGRYEVRADTVAACGRAMRRGAGQCLFCMRTLELKQTLRLRIVIKSSMPCCTVVPMAHAPDGTCRRHMLPMAHARMPQIQHVTCRCHMPPTAHAEGTCFHDLLECYHSTCRWCLRCLPWHMPMAHASMICHLCVAHADGTCPPMAHAATCRTCP